ncbi:MAG: acylphosphatase [Firmicutes bacterium]|nr:acylphosphatase [Bacillota bacterium]
MIRQKIIFIGRVQGVGFRYTMTALARQIGLTGYVKNEWDGSVVSEIQGDKKGIDWLIQQLYEDRYIRIDRIVRENISPVTGERSFYSSYF